MISSRWTKDLAIRSLAAAAIYVGLIVCSLIIMVAALTTVESHRANIAAEENMLAQLEGRSVIANRGKDELAGTAPAGSPFLRGQTVNIAGAALLQRIAAAITRKGGKILSSEVDLQKTESKNGWIGLVVSCEIEEASLQNLLYDVEAGMPFLFIDQIVVDAPEVGGESGRLRVLLSVSGQWLARQ